MLRYYIIIHILLIENNFNQITVLFLKIKLNINKVVFYYICKNKTPLEINNFNNKLSKEVCL